MYSKMKYYLGCFLIAFLFICCIDIAVYASSDLSIYEPYIGEDTVTLYIRGTDDDVNIQVGTSLAEVKCDEPVAEAGNYIYSLVLIDNSKSIKKNDRARINELVSNMIIGRLSNEKIAIATFDNDQIVYLCDYSDDGINLQGALSSVKYGRHKSYLSDILYDFCSDNDISSEKNIFLRIIVISDGSDHDGGRYTDDELNKIIREKKIPIYAVCCNEKANAGNIKWFTSLSRETDASDFNITEATDLNLFVRLLQEDANVRRLEFSPKADMLDGTEKMVKIQAGTQSVSQLIRMPQKLTVSGDSKAEDDGNDANVTKAEEKSVPTSETVKGAVNSEKGKSDTGDSKTDKDPEQSESGKDSFFSKYIVIIIVGAAVILIIIMIVIWLALRRRNNSYSETMDGSVRKGEIDNTPSGAVTEKLPEEQPPIRSEDKQYSSDSKNYVRLTCLTENWEKQFPIADSVVIGRSYEKSGCVIDFDPSISREHCKISQRNGRFFLVNLSKNGTKIDDAEIYNEIELKQGAVITMGRTKVRFEEVSNDMHGTDMLFY